MNHSSRPAVLHADAAGLAEAADLLAAGGLVAVPTETVYGLAARADRDAAVAGIYRAKGRPSFNPLIVHVADPTEAERLAVFDEQARTLAQAFWPGPLTLVVALRADAPIAAAVTAGLPTIALRCPAHPVMRALIDRAGVPLAAPSANRSGGVSPTEARHVIASLGNRIDAVVDGGPCERGVESTIVAVRGDGRWQMLRPGPITREMVSKVLGCDDAQLADRAIEAPGQLASHYSPGKPLRLGAVQARSDEFHIGFGSVEGDITLSRAGDLQEAASRLYAALATAAAAPQPTIAVAPIPEDDIGAAINDRLRRAAA